MAGRDYVLEAGAAAVAQGQADWCAGCDKLRYRRDMRWLADLYRCRECLPEARPDPHPAWTSTDPVLPYGWSWEPIPPIEPIEPLR